MANTPIIGGPEWPADAASPWDLVNQFQRMVEAMARSAIIEDRDLTAPPVSCADGACYLVKATGTGLWTGHDGTLAVAVGANASNGWYFIIVATEGVELWVKDEDLRIRHNGTAWATIASGGTAAGLDYDTDGTLAANSDGRIATQKAVKTYVGAAVAGLLDFKGSTDCSANPNYPAASKGDAYIVSVAGKIGGASGTSVDAGDIYIASADNAGGTQAAVGASWFSLEHNGVFGSGTGNLLAANNLSDVASAATARTNLGADIYLVPFFATTAPLSSEVLLLHAVTDAFTFPANFATPNSRGAVGTNPAGSFALDVQRQVNATGAFSSIGTITVSTGGGFTFATASGTSKAIAANDVIKIVAPSSADASIANLAVSLRGSRT